MNRVASAAPASVAHHAHIVTAARRCENPRRRKRKWRWDWSAPDTRCPCLSRRATTNDVSMIGTASTSSGRKRTTVDAVFNRPCTETAASRNPSASAPESPMKIRAGKKLWRRKPMHAPATIAERMAGSIFPSESASTAYVLPAMAHTPAASPSMPSRKLTMFMTATIQSTVSGMPTTAGRSTGPKKGNVKWSIQTPKKGGIAAATTWPASLRPGLRTRKSSMAPTTVATAAPSSTPRVSFPSSRKASAGTKIPKKIARPPSRGIGLTFRRLLSGRSTTPRSRAIPPTAGVRRITIRQARPAP